jgi:hypothetical protein
MSGNGSVRGGFHGEQLFRSQDNHIRKSIDESGLSQKENSPIAIFLVASQSKSAILFAMVVARRIGRCNLDRVTCSWRIHFLCHFWRCAWRLSWPPAPPPAAYRGGRFAMLF